MRIYKKKTLAIIPFFAVSLSDSTMSFFNNFLNIQLLKTNKLKKLMRNWKIYILNIQQNKTLKICITVQKKPNIFRFIELYIYPHKHITFLLQHHTLQYKAM